MTPKRVLTEHAVKRYEQRVGGTRDDARQALQAGDVRLKPPAALHCAPSRERARSGDHLQVACYIVAPGGIVFPMVRHPDGTLVARTVLKVRKRPKADQRAWRREQRAERG